MSTNFKTSIQTPIGFFILEGTVSSITSATFSEFDIVSSKKLPPLAKQACKQVKEYFACKRTEFNLAIHQSGSPFQQLVWKELLKIPCGKISSYFFIARNIGNPKSARAVGNANSKNPIALLVPCHRVCGETGNLVGYAGGLWRKKWLLEHEAKIANGVLSLF